MNKKLDEQGYKLIVEDSELEIVSDIKEIEGYILIFKNSENKYLTFERGTLENLAKTDRDAGKQIIENLMPTIYQQGRFFDGTKLNYDSINAIATKAYLKEQENKKIWDAQQKFSKPNNL